MPDLPPARVLPTIHWFRFSFLARGARVPRPIRAPAALAALFFLLGSGPSFAQDDEGAAAALLTRMSAAVRTLDYQGSFIYEHDGRIDALRIFHVGGRHERERLISMSGARSEVVRDGATITCLQSGLPTVLFRNGRNARLLPLVPDTRAGTFAQNYALRDGGEDRVAGYRARIVEIVPRDIWRYGYRLWIGEGTHLLLRSAVVDGGQRALEQFMFVALDVGAKPKQSDLLPGTDAGVSALPAEIPLDRASQWHVADLPPGFRLLRAQRPAQVPAEAEHQMYTDGLANVSVYIEPRGDVAATDLAATRGVIALYAHADGAWKVTVLGDVPRATVERIARSVQPVADRR